MDVGEAVLHLLTLEGDFFEVAEALAAKIGRPVNPGIARVEFRLLVTAAEREIFLDGQPLACGLSECWNHRLAPGRRLDRKSTRLNSSPSCASRMPSSA